MRPGSRVLDAGAAAVVVAGAAWLGVEGRAPGLRRRACRPGAGSSTGASHVGDVQEAVATDGKVDESGLDGRFEVNNPAFVDVAGEAFEAGALDVEFLQNAIFDDGDPAFLGLEDVDQHLFLSCGKSFCDAHVDRGFG